ncbi:putative baseplate hub sub and tail lysozyme [Pseudomonas phage vB_PaeM_PA5oct]|uniref:Putative baseplate hub sub and tail lysozyme n=1 Tax=Pseudomonas phage vB_PaeM_PA5oct TaxID=2163605 RepID=A0A4Y5JTV6_9CAUD|nr:PAAR motif of membran proteins [Pseudomonas phage vB_PaeM_PA5oct]QCG76126.1 putative baseplate hub sub and tail lysozyme [Pseudomonas phage vB_PaeM_PA5oct]
MPEAVRLGDICSGHQIGYPPRPNVQGSPNVFVNNLPEHRVTDKWDVHCSPTGSCHNSTMAVGSPNVWVNNLPAARLGDLVGCTSLAAQGSPNVFINNGNTDPIIVDDVILPKDQNEYINAVGILPCGPLDYQEGDPIADEYETNSGGGHYPPLPQTTPPPPISKPPVDENNNIPPARPPIPTECPVITGSIDYSIRLSPNFTIGDLSIKATFPHAIKAQRGLTVNEIVCNLKSLAEHCLEPIIAQYPGARINSGFRNVQNGKSDHEKGFAADLQWPGKSYDQLWQMVLWVKDNVPYKQLIWEHGNMPWIHIAYARTGETSATRVMTMYQNQYSPGLKKMR